MFGDQARLTACSYIDMNHRMNQRSHASKTRRVTANLPVALLRDACGTTGKGITETLVQGLEMVRRAAALSKARGLKGKLLLDIDLGESRERAGR